MPVTIKSLKKAEKLNYVLANELTNEKAKNKSLRIKLNEKQKESIAKFKEDAKAVKEATKAKFKLIKENEKLKKKISKEPVESHAVQPFFNVHYLKKMIIEGEEKWIKQLSFFYGQKRELKFSQSTKDAVIQKFVNEEKDRIKHLFDDSDQQFVSIDVNKNYIDRIQDVTFNDLLNVKLYGNPIQMSMPSIGVNYKDFNSMCVPMGLLKHLNDPEKPKEKRIQSMTLEKIVEILCDEEEEKEHFETVLKMGYSANQILKLCSHEKVRIRAYCLDHRESILASNAHDIPDNIRNKNIPNLVFMAWNNHFYIIDDVDVKESVAHRYQARNIGCKQKLEKKENKKKCKNSCVLDAIPTDFKKYANMIIYIENKDNLVNNFFYDEVKRGIIHKERLRVKKQEVHTFEYTPTKTTLIYKPEFTEIDRICKKLNNLHRETDVNSENIYNVENHNLHSLGLSYYELNYGHTSSFMNTEGNDVMNSPLNSAFNEYWRRPLKYSLNVEFNEFLKQQPQTGATHQYDYSKHYTSCLINNELGFSVYSPLDEVQEFDYNLQEGFYYVETDNYFPMKGNGWYNGEPLREYVEDGIINLNDIKYQYLPSRTLSKDHFKNFVNDVFEIFGDAAKNAMNGFIGLLRKTNGKSSINYFTNNAVELCCHYNDFINQGYDLAQIPVNYIENDEGEVVAYHIMDEKTYPLPKSNIPIYRKIYDMSALFLWRLVKRVGGIDNVLGIHTDTIYFQGGNQLQEDGIKIGGIRKVCNAPWESVSIVERKVNRDYHYTNNKVMNDITAEELLSVDSGCMIKGEAGTGKSYVINHKLIPFFEERDIKYAICASTWKAAKKIKGVTVHSLFGIDPTKPTINISACMALHKQGIRHLIIDEISMIQEHIWGILHQIKDICRFIFYIVGDYSQLPPVNEEDIYKKFEGSHLVQYICDNRKLTLTQNRRLKDGEFVFYQELQNVLDGKGINESLYGHEECEFAIAYHNVVVDKHNMKYMKKNAEKAGKYEVFEDGKQTIYLFKGLKVIATVTNGDYVNCEDFVVESYDKKSIILKSHEVISSEEESEKRYACIDVPRKEFIKNFKPYYAITVHKAQGDTFDHPFTIYEYKTLLKKGRNFLYTALSRSTSLKHINLIDYCPDNKMGFIYQYEFENGKKYIGSTFNEAERRKQHLESTEKDKFHVQLRSGMKYTYSIIKSVDVSGDDELRKREAYYIALHNTVENGYNSKSI